MTNTLTIESCIIQLVCVFEANSYQMSYINDNNKQDTDFIFHLAKISMVYIILTPNISNVPLLKIASHFWHHSITLQYFAC